MPMDPGMSVIAANWGIAVGGFFLGVAGMFGTIYKNKNENGNGNKKDETNNKSANGTNNPENKYVLQGVCDARYNNLESRLTRIERKLDEILEKM